MKLDIDNNVLAVTGNIISNEDFANVKQALESMKSHGHITMNLHDALVISSSLIGYLTKLINQDGVTIHINAGTDTLYELLEDIHLIDTFHVKKV